MQQRTFIQKAISSSSQIGTPFINRNFFSTYYLGTLLSKELHRQQGDIGVHMPAQTQRRLQLLWDRADSILTSGTPLGPTRQALLNPLLDLLGFVDVRPANPASFREFGNEDLPRGFHIYYPPNISPAENDEQALLLAAAQDDLPGDTQLTLVEPLPAESEDDEDTGYEQSALENDEDAEGMAELPGLEENGVLLALLGWEQDFDAPFPTSIHRKDTPAKLVERLLASGPAQWGLLFNGPRIRLMKRTIGVGRQQYFEVDLDVLCRNSDSSFFTIFWTLFRAQSFQRRPDGKCFLDHIDEHSRQYALGVSTTLKGSVFRAIETLMKALVDRASELDRQTFEPDQAAQLQQQELARAALTDLRTLYDQALVLLYRLLFVFYAESRNLLPVDRPIYRDSYSLQPLRDAIESNREFLPGSFQLWESLQALFRLIRHGCNTTELTIPAYNGSLFNPQRTHYIDALRVSDLTLQTILLDLSVTSTKERGRERIDYSDLGVEQLGSVYEGLLEFEPRVASEEMVEVRYKSEHVIIARRDQREYKVERTIPIGTFYLGHGAGRKVSGSYYTPQPLVDFLVRRTLEPLVEGRTPEEILNLKVVDPAMGSGAFLVGACLYLAEAYARAKQRQERAELSDEELAEENDEEVDTDAPAEPIELSEEETRPYRRLVAERCLYGVDLNEMAVELAKVSLWLTTLAGDKPLTFLNANLRHGNSLISAPLIPFTGRSGREYTIERIHPEALKLLLQAHGGKRSGNKKAPTEEGGLWKPEDYAAVAPLIQFRRWIAETPSDTVDLVHRKEGFMHDLEVSDERSKFKRLCDLWVASWFWHQPPAKKPKPKRVQAIQTEMFAPQQEVIVEDIPAIESSSETQEQDTQEDTEQVQYAPLLNGQIYAELVSYFKAQRQTKMSVNPAPYETEIDRILKEIKPFHWELEFPEVFYDDNGIKRMHGGFDAILANPPWESVQTQSQEFFSAYDPGFRELERVAAKKRQNDLLNNDEIYNDWNNFNQEIEKQVNYYRLSEVYLYQLTEVDGAQTKGHTNTYKLFLEKSLNLLRQNGACGMIVPGGLYNDHSCTGLRQLFFYRTRINYLFAFENRREIFPIHRSFKFVLFGFQKQHPKDVIDAAFMLQNIDILSNLEKQSIHMPIRLVQRFSPSTLSMMEFRSNRDLDVTTHIYGAWPLIGDGSDQVWTPTIRSEEINTTHHRRLLNEEGVGWILYNGKMLHQYTNHFKGPRYWVKTDLAWQELARKEVHRIEDSIDAILLSNKSQSFSSTRKERLATILTENMREPLTSEDVHIDPELPRLIFRKVARGTDERTFITTILPPKSLLGHTIIYFIPWIFDAQEAIKNLGNIKNCYKPALLPEIMAYLCGVCNSFVIDYIVRFKVNTDVSKFYVNQLPLPRLQFDNTHCCAIAQRVARLVCVGSEFDELRQELLGSIDAPVIPFEEKARRQQVQNEIDALVAHLYGLTREDLQHILFAPYTFPLVAKEIREGVMEEFEHVEKMLRDK